MKFFYFCTHVQKICEITKANTRYCKGGRAWGSVFSQGLIANRALLLVKSGNLLALYKMKVFVSITYVIIFRYLIKKLLNHFKFISFGSIFY